MPVQSYRLDHIGVVHVHKRSGTKSMRLSISADGKVRVTVPAWSTYSAALAFAESRSRWILDNLPQAAPVLSSGQHIGKAHRLVFDTSAAATVRSRISGSEIHIIRPSSYAADHTDVQSAAHKACIRALRLQAEKLLPGRLKELAEKHGFEYSGVSVKQLKGRWGSCDSNQHITLNLFLMQLPWKLIDYVLLHELVHTKHMNHGEDFWAAFLTCNPYAKEHRRQIRRHKPVLESAEAVELARHMQ